MPHNGKRVQTNPSFPFVGVDWPFLNVLKTAGAWFNADNFFPEDVSAWDANGYPMSDPVGHGGFGLAMLATIPSQSDRAGPWVCKWSGGDATTHLTMQSHVGGGGNFSPVASGTGANGRFTLQPNSDNDVLEIKLLVTGNPHVTNLRVCHADDEVALDGGATFGARFKQLMSECGVIRFLDWQFNNTTNIAKWAHRKPVAFYNYNANYFPAELMTAGLTFSVGDAFTIAKPGFQLVDKAQVILRFDHDVLTPETSLPTLNVAATGVKPIKNFWGQVYNGTPIRGSSTNASYSLATYDASLDSWLLHNGQFERFGIMAGVPPEICLQLCAEVGAHPWFCAPYLAVDCGIGQLPTMTDYMAQLATYCRDNAPAWMIPYFEPPNETWNNVLGFYATRYGWKKQNVRMGLPATTEGKDGDWIGTVGSLIGQAVSAVYGDDRAKYRMVIGYALFNPQGYPPDSGEAQHRLNSTYYVSQGGSAANNWATHLCYANYFNPWYFQTSKWETLAYQYSQAATQSAKDALADEYLTGCTQWDGVGDSGGFSLPVLQPRITAFADYAAAKGKTICHYEGGYSPDFWNFDGWTSIVGITRGTTTVIALSNTVNNLVKQNAAWNAALAGMQIRIDGVGGTTGLNGNTYTVLSATPFTITLDVDSSGMGNYTGGGIIVYVSMQAALNTLQRASKFRPAVKAHTLGIYDMLETAGSEFPSEYSFAGANSPFTIFDPNIYIADPPRWQAVLEFNGAAPPEPPIDETQPPTTGRPDHPHGGPPGQAGRPPNKPPKSGRPPNVA